MSLISRSEQNAWLLDEARLQLIQLPPVVFVALSLGATATYADRLLRQPLNLALM